MPAIRGETVVVLRPAEGEPDAMGEPARTWEREVVEGVLAAPGSSVSSATGGTADLAASRPDGAKVDMTFHFPRGYGRGLRGCRVEHGGAEYRVVGDPKPYMEGNTPGRWSLAAECEACHG